MSTCYCCFGLSFLQALEFRGKSWTSFFEFGLYERLNLSDTYVFAKFYFFKLMENL